MQAIFDLDKMLTAHGIPHEMRKQDGDFGWQIVYPNYAKWKLGKRGCGDVVWNRMSYGNNEGLLEAMGFDITVTKYGDEVVGYLTANEAFDFFKRQYENDCSRKKSKKKGTLYDEIRKTLVV